MFPYLRFAQLGVIGVTLMTSSQLDAATAFDKAKAEKLWQGAQQAFVQGDSVKCYQQLKPISGLLLGEIAYDRLLGLCASAAGEHELALLAFERIIAQQPQNAEILLERGRALYILGQYREARKDFVYLSQQNPPAKVAPILKGFIERIDEKLKPKLKVSTRLSINAKIGYDSNANSASELDEFLGFIVSENSRSNESSVYGVDVRLQHSRPVAERMLLTVSTALSSKRFPDAEFVDQDLGLVSAGLSHIGERHINRFNVFGYGQAVDGNFNSRGYFARYSHTYKWTPNTDLGTYYKGGAIRYNTNLRVRDVNQYTIGGTLRHQFDTIKRQSVGFDLNFGRDYQIFRNSNYRRDIYNLSVDHNYQWSDHLLSKLALSYSVYDFKSPFFPLAFPEPRDDEQIAAVAEMRWKFNDSWTLIPRVGYNDLESSVGIYEFERFYYELNLTRHWLW